MKKTIPPISGMQASAAAIFEGSPVDLGESEAGGGGGGGASDIKLVTQNRMVFVNPKALINRWFCFSNEQKLLPFRRDLG